MFTPRISHQDFHLKLVLAECDPSALALTPGQTLTQTASCRPRGPVWRTTAQAAGELSLMELSRAATCLWGLKGCSLKLRDFWKEQPNDTTRHFKSTHIHLNFMWSNFWCEKNSTFFPTVPMLLNTVPLSPRGLDYTRAVNASFPGVNEPTASLQRSLQSELRSRRIRPLTRPHASKISNSCT